MDVRSEAVMMFTMFVLHVRVRVQGRGKSGHFCQCGHETPHHDAAHERSVWKPRARVKTSRPD
jgi:hypothetical protein